MITAFLLMLAAPDSGATASAHASVRIVSAEAISFVDLDAGLADQQREAQFTVVLGAPDPNAGSNGETRLVEFQ